jgi:deazaflavin-dependent oxidoreductase (nitroreductase family)
MVPAGPGNDPGSEGGGRAAGMGNGGPAVDAIESSRIGAGVAEASDWNSKIIKEFRENEGKVGGPFQDRPLLLLHTTGARTGQPRVNPVAYQAVNGNYAVFASKAGAPVNPDWYHNLLANPRVRAEIGTGTGEFTARVAEGQERDRIWEAQKSANPGFAEYERKTTRQIPVVILEPVS